MEKFKLNNQKVLVTGGAGFVGSIIVGLLADMGAKVTILDNLYTGEIGQIPRKPNIEFVEGDVCDAQLVDELIKKHKFIIHAAAKNIIASTKNPLADFETNIGGTLNVLMAAKKHGIKNLVYTGSASVYGNPSVIPIPEITPLYTLSPYAVSKLAGENYCISFYESYDIPVSIVRYSNVYGINQDPQNPYCGVVSKFFESALRNEDIKIHGDGEQTRDFTFVLDSARATIEALINPRAIGMVFNTGTGTEISINQLAKVIIEISNSQSKIKYIDKRDIDNIRRRVVNVENIRRVLRWNPKYTLKQGLLETHEWLTEKQKGASN